MEYNLERLKAGALSFGVDLSEKQLDQFLKFYEMLVETNKVMNLTAITEFDEVVEKHFIDSLSLAKVYNLNQDINVLDLGTGAGFPGIPLAIAFPELRITLMDSLNKRIKFLKDVIDVLELENVEAIHGRAEETARNTLYREQFNLCVSRAVANISTLSEYCLPFVKQTGEFISYKSASIDDEIKSGTKAIELLGGELKEVYKFVIPETDLQRSFIIINKVKSTPKKYPRKAGTPSKEPL